MEFRRKTYAKEPPQLGFGAGPINPSSDYSERTALVLHRYNCFLTALENLQKKYCGERLRFKLRKLRINALRNYWKFIKNQDVPHVGQCFPRTPEAFHLQITVYSSHSIVQVVIMWQINPDSSHDSGAINRSTPLNELKPGAFVATNIVSK